MRPWPGSPGPGTDGSSAGTISVCVRLRPLKKAETAKGDKVCVSIPGTQDVVICHPARSDSKCFAVDRAFNSLDEGSADFADQELVMDQIGLPLVRNTLEGYNTCLFAYGQTGSGKTFSILGKTPRRELRGLLPRMAEEVFTCLSTDRDDKGQAIHYVAHVQFVEIYNEQLRDLLATPEEQQKKLEVRTDPKIGVHVHGAKDVPVFGAHEVEDWLDFGMKARSVGATNMNAESSRSHCVFTLEVQRTKRNLDGRLVQLRSKMNLVDLAGSERTSRSGATGERFKEGCLINQSLTTLAIVINKLSKQNERGGSPNCSNGFGASSAAGDHIPYRSSKLTYLLSNSLSGNSKTVMLACLSPLQADYEETLSTLRFAESAKKVQLRAKRNEESTGSLVAELQAEVERLRQQIQETACSSDAHALSTELEATEALAAKYGQNIEERLNYAKRCEEQRRQVLQDAGLTLSGMCDTLGLVGDTPQLVSVSFDPSLSGCLVYFLQQGKSLSVGCEKGCHIHLTGLGMKPLMAMVENTDNQTLTISHIAGRVVLNTKTLTDVAPIAMKHTDVVTFGHAFRFRVVIPAAAAVDERGRAKGNLMTADPLVEILEEVVTDTESDFYGACLAYIKLVESRLGEARARSFLQKFQHLFPMVEEANELAGELRPQDRYEFTLEAIEDPSTHQTEAPECVVRLKKHPTGKNRLRSIIHRKVVPQTALVRLTEEVTKRRAEMTESPENEPAQTVRLLTEAEFRERLRRLREEYNSNDAATGAWHNSAAARSRAMTSTDPFCIAPLDELLISGNITEEAVTVASAATRARADTHRMCSSLSEVESEASLFGDGPGLEPNPSSGEPMWRMYRREMCELEVTREHVRHQLEELERRQAAVEEREARLRREQDASSRRTIESIPGVAPHEHRQRVQTAENTIMSCVSAFQEAAERRSKEHALAFQKHMDRIESVASSRISACRGLLDDVRKDLETIQTGSCR